MNGTNMQPAEMTLVHALISDGPSPRCEPELELQGGLGGRCDLREFFHRCVRRKVSEAVGTRRLD